MDYRKMPLRPRGPQRESAPRSRYDGKTLKGDSASSDVEKVITDSFWQTLGLVVGIVVIISVVLLWRRFKDRQQTLQMAEVEHESSLITREATDLLLISDHKLKLVALSEQPECSDCWSTAEYDLHVASDHEHGDRSGTRAFARSGPTNQWQGESAQDRHDLEPQSKDNDSIPESNDPRLGQTLIRSSSGLHSIYLGACRSRRKGGTDKIYAKKHGTVPQRGGSASGKTSKITGNVRHFVHPKEYRRTAKEGKAPDALVVQRMSRQLPVPDRRSVEKLKSGSRLAPDLEGRLPGPKDVLVPAGVYSAIRRLGARRIPEHDKTTGEFGKAQKLGNVVHTTSRQSARCSASDHKWIFNPEYRANAEEANFPEDRNDLEDKPSRIFLTASLTGLEPTPKFQLSHFQNLPTTIAKESTLGSSLARGASSQIWTSPRGKYTVKDKDMEHAAEHPRKMSRRCVGCSDPEQKRASQSSCRYKLGTIWKDPEVGRSARGKQLATSGRTHRIGPGNGGSSSTRACPRSIPGHPPSAYPRPISGHAPSAHQRGTKNLT